MQKHVSAHLSGQLAGHIQTEWVNQHGKAKCQVCGLCVAASRERFVFSVLGLHEM